MNSIYSLQERLDRIPRLSLCQTPTPLEHLPRLSATLKHELFIKRDDGIGPGLGGNKTRKLEYLLADAKHKGARKVVTFGGLHSNHARLTAAAATQLGLEVHLFYFEPRPSRLEGNLLLNHLLGAKMHFVPFGGGGGMSIEASNRLVRLLAFATVGPNYFIPVGGHCCIGALGYTRAAMELTEQARSQGVERAKVILAAGTGSTLAGLLAGFSLLRSPMRLLAIDVGKLWKGFPASIAHLAGEICAYLNEPFDFEPAKIPLLEATYVGPGYAQPFPPANAAIRFLARQEGILLDPVYTGKAFAGMLDLIEKGALGKDEPLIFLHTGGLPSLFAYDLG